ncbi:Macoilin-1 [Frankliniella fusca]|uniref:Macoilin n=1 Tax=Frankliniella fusca TaxID=407009 RepID=A0AAE1HMP6_9NEOP|nr:Macoilin-1 [Frankliniella fusca]
MKRRNADCKLRRPLKKTKITDGIWGSSLLYLKFFVLWALVLLADFLLEFRFEYLWPFYLLLRSVYDSFKYQGLAFSVFFICIALTSDMICLFFIPVHWLFFAASTYVWVQYVWHTEKGLCLPTCILWMVFVYMEVAVRLRDVRHMPFHLDLCRPFAAHCIGYPVVTLGFGFKSYIGYRMRQGPYCEINGVTHPVITNSIPVPKKDHKKHSEKSERDKEKVSTQTNETSSEKCPFKFNHSNGSLLNGDIEIIERIGSVNDFDENEEHDKSVKGCQSLKSHGSNGSTNSRWSSSQAKENSVNTQRERRNKANKDASDSSSNSSSRDDYCQRLEADVKRLKIDLQSSRQTEQDLRSQVTTHQLAEKSIRCELAQCQKDNEELQAKLHVLVSARQADKQLMVQTEKKLTEERRLRSNVESQLAAERKAKKAEEAATARAVAMAAAAAASAANKSECTETCKARRRDLETENKQLQRELKLKEERITSYEREIVSLRQFKENQTDTEILMTALSAMQEKNSHLENSLSAETRIKLDLFSALGEAKRQLEIRDTLLRQQEREVEALKSKMAQVLAVMPTDSFGPLPSGATSKLLLTENPGCTMSTLSNLDPNATAYTPKGSNMAASTEA